MRRRISTSDSRVARSRSWALLLTLALGSWVLPSGARAQAPRGPAQDVGVGAVEPSTPSSEVGCGRRADDPDCAPDQRLDLDSRQPQRRFASYSDLVAWARARVSLGLVLSPFPPGPLARLRFEVEAVTRLRSPRGVELTGRAAWLLVGQGLDGLFAGVGATYVARVQPGGRVLVSAELGYARHFASLYVSVSAGASVQVWSRDGRHRAAPLVRLALGHAFY